MKKRGKKKGGVAGWISLGGGGGGGGGGGRCLAGVFTLLFACSPTAYLRSFNNIRYWMENIQKHANPQTQKLLLGNKIDMKGKKVGTYKIEMGGGAGEKQLPTFLCAISTHPTPVFHFFHFSCRSRAVAAVL
jgi:hypothetical protein